MNYFFGLLLLAFTLGSCGQQQTLKRLDHIEASLYTKDINTADKINFAHPDIVLLDVRTPEEFAQGHLQGAINIDVQAEDFAQDIVQLDPNKTYYIYCRSGARAQVAKDAMDVANMKKSYPFRNGITDYEGQLIKGGLDENQAKKEALFLKRRKNN